MPMVIRYMEMLVVVLMVGKVLVVVLMVRTVEEYHLIAMKLEMKTYNLIMKQDKEIPIFFSLTLSTLIEGNQK